MAKKVEGYIKLQIAAGKATPAPPVGPALGQHGVNIVEFNGCRLVGPTGRTGNTYIYVHTYQLALGTKEIKYIKEISKYNDRCTAKRNEIPVTAHDSISSESNLELYKMFMDKCKDHVYINCFGEFEKLYNEMKSGEKLFEKMSIWNQVKQLLEILKSFQTNTVYSNMKELGGVGTRGRIGINKNISALDSAYLIHQSITGLFEYRINLLGK